MIDTAAQATTYWLTRFCFQRSLGFIYFIAFLILIFQLKPLIGANGLLPAPLFIKKVRFWEAPSLFHVNCSNTWMMVSAWLGLLLSILALTGVSDAFGFAVSIFTWGALWVLYLSFTNIGQTFYGFGWETLLLETGFLAIFLGPSKSQPPVLVIWLLRWVLFRLMFGAGLIKLRGDECWRNLTCMFYHYQTQPLPNPLSWYFHRLPPLVHKASVLSTHFIELIVPFGYFGPHPIRTVAGLLTIVFQVSLILSGNLSWLNYITIVLCISCFDDAFLSKIIPLAIPTALESSSIHYGATIGLAGIVFLLSIRPVLNLVSRSQLMNTSFEPLHLVNTYGAFGSITRHRTEVVLEGTLDTTITPDTQWREYEFKAKPGNVKRMPRIVSPYHYKLDWQMWFAAMSSYWDHPWILNLVAKLLQNDENVLSLMGHNPFPESPPRHIRARLYLYQFADPNERKQGYWWKRGLVEEYLPPLSLDDPSFRKILQKMQWIH